MKGNKPLVCKLIILHFVTHLPSIHGSAKMDLVISWSSVMKHEHLWLLGVVHFVKGTHDRVNFKKTIGRCELVKVHLRLSPIASIIGRWIVFHLFCSTLIDVAEKLVSLFASEYLFDQTDWLVVTGVPRFGESFLCLIDNFLINKVFICKSTEF